MPSDGAATPIVLATEPVLSTVWAETTRRQANLTAMTIDALNPSVKPDAPAPPQTAEAAVAALTEMLLERGLVDAKTLERARRVAAENGQRLDSVLIQLGMIGERGLAE